MTKLQFLQAVLVVWCVVIYSTSEAVVQHEEQFKQFIKTKVIGKFKTWANVGFQSTQFAVMLLMDTDMNWNSFKYLPEQPQAIDSSKKEQPREGDRVNYYVALPNDGEHSEERLLNNFEDLLNAYKSKNNEQNPVTVVLYTWYCPCCTRKYNYGSGWVCNDLSCTNKLVDFYKEKLEDQGIHLIVAYSKEKKLNNQNFSSCIVNKQRTKQLFDDEGIDLVHVPPNQVEALIETMTRLSKLFKLIE